MELAHAPEILAPVTFPLTQQGERLHTEFAKVMYRDAGQNSVCAGCDVVGHVRFRDVPTHGVVEADPVAGLAWYLILIYFAAQI